VVVVVVVVVLVLVLVLVLELVLVVVMMMVMVMVMVMMMMFLQLSGKTDIVPLGLQPRPNCCLHANPPAFSRVIRCKTAALPSHTAKL